MMPDPRFYLSAAPATLGELAVLTGAILVAAGLADETVDGVAILTHADGRRVSYCADGRLAAVLTRTAARACFLDEGQREYLPASCAAFITRWPQAAYAVAAQRLHKVRRHDVGAPSVHPSAWIEEGAVVVPGATVGQGAAIGRGTRIAHGAVIGPGVMIGRESYIGANSTVGFALIGDRVRIDAGAVIGEPGFGAAAGPKGIIDIPQLGRVILQDGVTVGANSCIDRGAFEDTVVGENTKIDNLVQIAHNVVIGRNCVLAAHTGISGSVTIGDGCMLGGRVGIADHLTIGAGAKIAAAAGVMKNIPAGERWGGFPARPMSSWMRQSAWLMRASERRGRGEGDT